MSHAPCPTCREIPSADVEKRWLPFCSERCKWIDLSRWLDESYRIPAEEAPDSGEPVRGDEQ